VILGLSFVNLSAANIRLRWKASRYIHTSRKIKRTATHSMSVKLWNLYDGWGPSLSGSVGDSGAVNTVHAINKWLAVIGCRYFSLTFYVHGSASLTYLADAGDAREDEPAAPSVLQSVLTEEEIDVVINVKRPDELRIWSHIVIISQWKLPWNFRNRLNWQSTTS